MTDIQRNRAEDILAAAQIWAAERYTARWEDLMMMRTNEVVYIRAHMAYRMRLDGLALAEIGKYIGRSHASIIHMLEMHDSYQRDPIYKKISMGIDALTPSIKQPINSNIIMFNATITGIIGKDAEPVSINSKQYSRFSVAVDGKKDQEPTWVKVLAYAGKGTQYFKKGAKVIVTGRLTIGVYQDKPDVTVWADNVEITKFADDGKASAKPQTAPQQAPEQEDLPF